MLKYLRRKKYSKNDLLVEIQQIPNTEKGIKKNIKEILKTIKFIDYNSEKYDNRHA